MPYTDRPPAPAAPDVPASSLAAAREVLARTFGYPAFRPGQEELIGALLAGRDVLGVMPTGAGKSLCYQVPALMLPGITLVISPLISLMRDQVLSLVQAGAPAAYINSSLTWPQFREVLRRMEQGRYKLVYVAPERLSLPQFQELCARLPISLVAVDEAHCISQWGQDFRPDYLKIAEFLACLPRRPLLGAFTATATERVKADVVRALGLREPVSVTTGFDRPNLYFAVRQPADKNAALLRELERQRGRSGIVYCATRKKVEEVCALLNKNGFEAAAYHAGLEPEERAAAQEDYLFDRKPIMVATNAFGMGIDKSNVSFVIHYHMPKSVEAYYQEAGRAGRDGEPADCVLFYAPGDLRLQQFLIEHSEPNPDLTEAQQEESRRQDYVRLSQMKAYALESGCLRAYILRYFGETPPAHCDYCSNCLENTAFEDITLDAQKILSCVKRCGERYGLSMVSRVLHGEEDERIQANGLDALTTYGILGDMRLTAIRRRVRTLVDQGYLAEEGEYRVLRLTPAAWEVLRGEQSVSMRVEKKEQARPTRAGAGVDQALFERLRQLRMDIAREERRAPFMIFSDASLRDMCLKRPTTIEAFLDVSGVGRTKAAQYGPRFTALLRTVRAEDPDAPGPVDPAAWTPGAAVRHTLYGPGEITAWEGDRLTVRFPDDAKRSFLFPDSAEKGILRIGEG